MYRKNLWECLVHSSLCYYSICSKCGKININTKAEKIEDGNNLDFELLYKCTKCGHKFTMPFKNRKGEYRGFIGKYIPKTYCVRREGKEGVKWAVVVTPNEIAIMDTERQKFMPSKNVVVIEGTHTKRDMPEFISDISDALKYEIEWQIESCPKCHKMNLADNIKGIQTSSGYSEFTCSCGEKYKRRRYTVTKINGKMFMPRLDDVKELSNKSGKVYYGICYNGGYLVKVGKNTYFVENGKIFEKK